MEKVVLFQYTKKTFTFSIKNMKGPKNSPDGMDGKEKKKTGTERKRQIREEQEAQQKTKKIVQYVAGAVLTVAGIIGGYHFLKSDPKEAVRPNTPQPIATRSAEDIELRKKYQCIISPELKDILQEKTVVIEKAFYEYIKAYGCSTEKIDIGVEDFSSETELLHDGKKLATEEKALSGEIKLDKNILKKIEQEDDTAYIRNIIIHAMTHATKKTGAAKWEKSITLPDKAKAFGCEGFQIAVQLPNKQTAYATTIEEAACEALAANLKNYSVTDPKYFRLGSFMIMLIRKNGITEKKLASMLQDHGLTEFLKTVLQTEELKDQDYIQCMDFFQKVSDGDDPKNAVEKLENYRNIRVAR